MTRIEPLPGAGKAHRLAGERHLRRLASELPQIREAAVAWRNGIAGLLAGLVGFSLIKGRSDVSQLARPWAVAVGVLLLMALVVGVAAANRILRAAHGRPRRVRRAELRSPLQAAHADALDATRLLDTGIRLALVCAAILVAAVATTWYGPEKQRPELRVGTPDGAVCGTVVGIRDGVLTVATAKGYVQVGLATVTRMAVVTGCDAG